MTETKPALSSVGLWGGVATVITGVAALAGVMIDSAELANALTIIAVSAANIVTGLIATWGRLRATKRIE